MKTKTLRWLLLTTLWLPLAAPCLAADKVPDGWRTRGATNDYEVGLDNAVRKTGQRSAYVKAITPSPRNFINLMQSFRAEAYRGKRLRLSGQVKVQGTGAETQLWMRIDTASKGSVAFDNMADRIIPCPSDWKKYEIVLDVPPDSLNLSFGAMFTGNGQAWVDDFRFEVVNTSVPVTQPLTRQPADKKSEPADQKTPVNLDFEK